MCYTDNIPTMGNIFKVLILLTLVRAGISFSSGAAACFSGDANVRAQHISNLGQPAGRSIVTGSLADGGLQVLFGGDPLSTASTFFFTVGEEYPIRVVGEQDYRGILIRLQAATGVDTTAALVVEENFSDLLQDASICSDPIQGITHTSAVLKNNVGGTTRLDELADVSIGVTIVVANNSTDSIYYFSQFQLAVTEAPTAVPTVPPTRFPTRTPTRVPTPVPTQPPTKFPTEAPSRVPTKAPTNAPTDPPTLGPTQVPSRAPSELPSFAPSPGPSAHPSRTPTGQPSQSPTKSSQPSVFCVAEGDKCTANDTCCGTNICVGVCSRNIKAVQKDSDSSRFKLSDGLRTRGSGSAIIRVPGTSRRKLLKGSRSRPNQE
jgi:hypothetical protein